MSEEVKIQVETVSKSLATISLNPNGMINIAVDKATFVNAIANVFIPQGELVDDNKPQLSCPPLLCIPMLCYPMFCNPMICIPIVGGCKTQCPFWIQIDPRDVLNFYDKGILTDKDLTAEQIKILKEIREKS